ncbi:hypothetical protein, unlikely [Trypanosoma brucei gambiense DAL972]|uniref:Uncharacterized protein n=1 Tax=Trypanosoma brucei gambiense (strain MHOM/CI/86/DAL972) TaxID=679716 RepID=D0A3P9_TRYB9|nr:hypothetical protein, unlikely [Trypanosoma brucei gambiense DAL972]CBH15893.1 hypothetical protein, unlikely [Trypanosoma brucei gambiense DAL972]|eukprot:XP_011778157.1 hypothetical protein, unlikely [Trypanosoma brucei gambiense DAL972]
MGFPCRSPVPINCVFVCVCLEQRTINNSSVLGAVAKQCTTRNINQHISRLTKKKKSNERREPRRKPGSNGGAAAGGGVIKASTSMRFISTLSPSPFFLENIS